MLCALRPPCFRAGTPDTWDNLYAFFLNRVRDRLHVVLCFSPVGPKFARWAQQVITSSRRRRWQQRAVACALRPIPPTFHS